MFSDQLARAVTRPSEARERERDRGQQFQLSQFSPQASPSVSETAGCGALGCQVTEDLHKVYRPDKGTRVLCKHHARDFLDRGRSHDLDERGGQS